MDSGISYPIPQAPAAGVRIGLTAAKGGNVLGNDGKTVFGRASKPVGGWKSHKATSEIGTEQNGNTGYGHDQD